LDLGRVGLDAAFAGFGQQQHAIDDVVPDFALESRHFRFRRFGVVVLAPDRHGQCALVIAGADDNVADHRERPVGGLGCGRRHRSGRCGRLRQDGRCGCERGRQQPTRRATWVTHGTDS
jgi:hypothetical protein